MILLQRGRQVAMATLATVIRERKSQLRQLMVASRRLDAAQETLEREIKRLVTRKKSVPEIADAERLTNLTMAVDAQVTNMAQVIKAISGSWGTSF